MCRLPARVGLVSFEHPDDLIADRKLFEAHGGCTHLPQRHHDRIVRHLFERGQLDRAKCLQRLFRQQLADVRIATTAGCQKHRAAAEIGDLLMIDRL